MISDIFYFEVIVVELINFIYGESIWIFWGFYWFVIGYKFFMNKL